MLALKAGVRLHGIRPELLVALQVAEAVWAKLGAELTVTAAVDSTHKRGSAHYNGCALDLRSKVLQPQQVAPAIADLRGRLGADFDVIIEDQGGDNEHCHVEYQPKDPY